MRKFAVSFLILFVVLFVLFNLRFVDAQTKFWLSKHPVLKKTITSLPFKENAYAFMPLSADKDALQANIAAASLAISKNMYLEIPSINVKAPIVFEESTDEDAIYKKLENGVVHYAGTAMPGGKGTAVILGHSSAYPWYRGSYGSVFALLGNLKEGDTVYVNKNGKYLIYQVKESVVFNPLADDSNIASLESGDGSSIVLISCYPVGTNTKRIGVRADLVE